jgi:hypothetical protein
MPRARILGDLKTRYTEQYPFSVLYDELHRKLSHESLVVVGGYSFGDRPLNRALARFLSRDSRSRLDRLGGAERIVPAHLDAAMAHLPRPERDLAARVLRFLVTPSGTKIAHRASDLAAYAEVPADKVGLLLERLSGQQARILRGTDDGRYEIYHDVLAAAILDWRARHLQAIRRAKRRRRLGFAFLLLILLTGGIILLNASSNHALRVLGNTVIGFIIAGAAIILLFSFGVWWGHKHL